MNVITTQEPQRVASGKKPRTQGKIANLTPKQREVVHQWFCENLSYSGMQRRFKQEFGSTIGQASLCRYYSKHRLEFCQEAQSSDVEVVLHIQIRPELRRVTPLTVNHKARSRIK
jgi:hypothetical protein